MWQEHTIKLTVDQLRSKPILFFSAIADTSYVDSYVAEQGWRIEHFKFSDHHHYTKQDLYKIAKRTQNRYLLTTEKDAVKLYALQDLIRELKMEIYCLPIQVQIAFHEQQKVEEHLLALLR